MPKGDSSCSKAASKRVTIGLRANLGNQAAEITYCLEDKGKKDQSCLKCPNTELFRNCGMGFPE